MKIYTKKGDDGSTALFGGRRVAKHALRIEAYGTVDELNSFLGFLYDREAVQAFRSEIASIQERFLPWGRLLPQIPKRAS